jgi:dolichol-phosphate mannosyltransferase
MEKLKKITLLIPCHNEALSIAQVIDNVPKDRLRQLGYESEVLVIDNNSNDETASIAREHGARVIFEGKKGKGNAIRAGFNALSDDTIYVFMVDGDHTYKPAEIPRLLEPLESGFCDVVVGSRLGGKMSKDALHFRNRVVNWGFTFLVRQFYQANVTDVLSGFFAWKKEVVDGLRPHLNSEGFAIEMEMITKMVKLGFELYSVPITYDVRIGKTKINALRDGLRILSAFSKYLFWKADKGLAISQKKE